MDNFLKEVDYMLDILHIRSKSAFADKLLTNDEKKQSQRVMRVNHMGEVCAQALYRGQALTTDDDSTKKIILKMCEEEREHLEICDTRISELLGRTSYLNPVWYTSSFILGAFVGKLTKDKSLGFIHETEEQVEKHLEEYTEKLPEKDKKSRDILLRIKKDESRHKETAKDLGSANLSEQTKDLMSYSSKIMKKISYYL